MRKKILIFSTAYLPLTGGAEIAVKEITQRLPAWEFDLITAKIKKHLSSQEKIGNVNVYRVGVGKTLDKFYLPLLGFQQAYILDKKNNYDIFWSIMASQAGVLAGFFKSFYPQKKLLLTLQEGDNEEHLERYALNNAFLYSSLVKPFHLLPFRKADCVQAISPALHGRAIATKRLKQNTQVCVIPNGVDLSIFKRASNEEIQELKNKLNIGPDKKIIITVSRLVKKNGISDLIKAGEYLSNIPFKMLIIGSGELEKELKQLAGKLNLEDRIMFLGHVDYEELYKYYSLADVFVRPSLSEGFGNVFLEALACGTPIIGTKAGGSAVQCFPSKEAVLYCRAGDPENIACQIKIILARDSDKVIKESIKLVEEKYTWDKIAKQMEEVFLKLC